ncbi:LacI family DNA-binding transcriptional regulator [Bauldia litoralis]|uniref:LacI family DNA-binding transcriptional regulator n=1 Tax=Bauldia litoralis TaxID=665467 RepID=UPI0032642529
MTRPVRLKDVAKAAGVSQGTASNVFNRPGLVRPAVRERVLETARRLDYSGPDPRGRLLRAGTANAIGVVTHTAVATAMTHPKFQSFIQGIAEVCDARQAALVIVPGVDRQAADRSLGTALVDGFILHNPRHVDSLIAISKRRNLPLVGVDMEAPAGISAINLDNRHGARQAVRHLVELGHRKVAILALRDPDADDTGPQYHPAGEAGRRLTTSFIDARERYEGIAEALGEAGLSIDDAPIVEGRPEGPDIRAAARLMLDNLAGATAIIAMADTLAVGVLDEALRRGIAVPADLSVVGFDDLPIAATSLPKLTTIAQSTRAKGKAAAELILDPPAHAVRRIMPVDLIVRESTASPPSR